MTRSALWILFAASAYVWLYCQFVTVVPEAEGTRSLVEGLAALSGVFSLAVILIRRHAANRSERS